MSLLILGCEEVVIIELPREQNLVVVEGWVTDTNQRQYVRLTRSNSFSGVINPAIEDATVLVQVRNSVSHTYSYSSDGVYLSDAPYQGIAGEEYRVSIVLSNGDVIRSDWNLMESKTEIILISVDFDEEDPDNPFYFPRITARDSADYENYYRWKVFKNDIQFTEPESIILQDDRFFDGNFIRANFIDYEYDLDNEIKLELHTINESTFQFLSLLKAQTTTLSAASSSTPAIVNGNLTNLSKPSELVLGFFGTTAVSADSVIVQ